jgi:hypothetical protein
MRQIDLHNFQKKQRLEQPLWGYVILENRFLKPLDRQLASQIEANPRAVAAGRGLCRPDLIGWIGIDGIHG